MTKNEEICELMDKLTIEMLELIQEKVQCEINIEKRTNEGNLLLAKARYIQGTNSVSTSQLPTENTTEFAALVKVTETESDNIQQKELILQKSAVNKDSGHIDPMRWFGLLVPRSLIFAKERFIMSIELAVECANIQRELLNVIYYLGKLKNVKQSL